MRRIVPRVCLLLVVLAGNPSWAFDFGDVMQLAGELAGRPYKPQPRTLPDELKKLGFEQHRSIRFRSERMLWAKARTQFEVSFVHMGMSFDRAVTINEISSDGVRRVAYDPQAFDYGALKLNASASAAALGFAGFRVHYPLNERERKDEVAVFLGASYFRALAEGLRYGLSARGLAVDTGESSGRSFRASSSSGLPGLRPAIASS